MATIRLEESDWLGVYPFKGLTIIDDIHDLDTPAFGDATLVSKNHLAAIINTAYADISIPEEFQFTSSILEDGAAIGNFDSYIVVKLSGPLYEIPGSTHQYIDPTPTLFKHMTPRVYQLSALLTIIFLMQPTSISLVGLAEQEQSKVVERVLVSLRSLKAHKTSQIESLINKSDYYKNVQLTRKELKNILTQPSFSNLTQTLTSQNSNGGDKFKKVLTQAAIRLVDAIHTNTFSSQLLGAVTAMEILLSQQEDKYELIQKRLKILLGEETIHLFRHESVFKARHSYVHNGQEVETPILSIRAVCLALSCLVSYSQLTTKFSNKPALLSYLDILSQVKNISSQSKTKFFDLALEHDQKLYNFKLIEYLEDLEALEADRTTPTPPTKNQMNTLKSLLTVIGMEYFEAEFLKGAKLEELRAWDVANYIEDLRHY